MGLMSYGHGDIDWLGPEDDLYDFEDPEDDAYERAMDFVLDHVARDAEQARAQERQAALQERRQEIEQLAERHPILRDTRQHEAIDARAREIAKQAGHADATDPRIVEAAVKAVEEANAPSAEDQAWGAVMAATGDPMGEPDRDAREQRENEMALAVKARREAGHYEPGEREPVPATERRTVEDELAVAFGETGDPLTPAPERSVSEQVASGVKEALGELAASGRHEREEVAQ